MTERSKAEVASIIRAFLDDKGDEWAWDDFISIPIKDQFLDRIRIRCASVSDDYPPPRGEKGYCREKGYCSSAGTAALEAMFKEVSEYQR
jgi:hypothetical protein